MRKDREGQSLQGLPSFILLCTVGPVILAKNESATFASFPHCL